MGQCWPGERKIEVTPEPFVPFPPLPADEAPEVLSADESPFSWIWQEVANGLSYWLLGAAAREGSTPNAEWWGDGAWARYARTLQGDALRAFSLLTELGIVTRKELKDDETPVAQDHMETCVRIGVQMLQLSLHDEQTAKEFFREQLRVAMPPLLPPPWMC
ncbi:unnamed protein product [Symbiodinium natans]|uniref:Uncharacterized protein n=1 Tax=Symbiodinium natans TaxID=878477 RepID=A0A812N2M2_9DINO|nr:unnamed protein product [Symbiodinium natans]